MATGTTLGDMMNGHFETCWVDGIIIPPHRARAELKEDSIEKLMESIKKIGLQTPVTLTLDEESGVATLIAGAHRLEAVKRLGWQEIPANFVEGWSENQARMWELAENLHRAELTVLERDEHVAEWIRLAEAESVAVASCDSNELRKDGRRKGQQHKESGIRAAARELGILKDAAHRATRVASLAPEAKEAARNLGLDDNQSALLQAARKTTAEEQIAALSERAAPKPKVKIAADPLTNELASENQVARLMDAWNAAGPEARQEFLLRIGQ